MSHLFLRHLLNRTAGHARSGLRRDHLANRPRRLLHLETLEGRCLPSTVTNLNDAGSGSLRQAILDTPAGGTVDFEPGLSGTITLTTGELSVAKVLTIAGPGADVITVSSHYRSRVFNVAASVTISGLTIADSIATNANGGGIFNAGTLTVSDCLLRGNFATGSFSTGGGGGIANLGTLTVTNSTLSGNSVATYGGGIYNLGTLTVTNSTLSGNFAMGAYASGGGIESGGGQRTATSTTLINSTLSLNQVFTTNIFAGGGGIAVDSDGPVTISNCTISGNSSLNGGGIWIRHILGGLTTVTECTISGNLSGSDGGGIWILLMGGSVTVSDCTISGNSSSRGAFGGGGIVINDGSPDPVTVSDCSITGNSAGSYSFGGGIAIGTYANGHGPVTVSDCTISGNFSGGGGGGMAIGAGAMTVTVSNCTISGNSSRGGFFGGGGILIGSEGGSVTVSDCTISGRRLRLRRWRHRHHQRRPGDH
jgi:hypothetical protein